MIRIPKFIMIFGATLGFCAATLPLTSNAQNVVLDLDTVSVTIDEYYELSVISNTGGTGVTYSDGTYSGTMTNGSALTNFGTTVLSAVGNGVNGWKIQAKSGTKNTSNVATMVGTATGLTIPSSSTTLNGTVSTWTMKLAAGTGNPTIASGFNAVHTIPATSTTIVTGAYGDPREVTITYGIGIGPTQAADTYIGSVEYTLSPNS